MRREDWMMKLIEAVEDAKLIPFVWGVHDCCLWAAHCVDVMCDTTHTADVKTKYNYTSKEDADDRIITGGGLPKMVTEFLGDPVRSAFAAPGDVVLARNGDGQPILGVMIGHQIVGPSPEGLLTLPFASGVLCWKV